MMSGPGTARESELEREKHELAARLQRVCSHMSPEDFARLVERIAQVNVKYRKRATGDYVLPLPHRPNG
jgi:hypothetical protein